MTVQDDLGLARAVLQGQKEACLVAPTPALREQAEMLSRADDALARVQARLVGLETLAETADLYELTLRCIKANAESWHGQGEEGPRRAHNVIAAWATNALEHGQLPPIAEDIAAALAVVRASQEPS